MEKKVIKTFANIGLLLMITSIVSAFGVAGTFSDKNTIKMYPGEKATINLELQNFGMEKDFIFKAEMENDGNKTAKLLHEDPTYTVPQDTRGILVPIEITIPKTATLGEYYEFNVYFKEQQGENEGAGVISVLYGMNFRVGTVVVEEGRNTFYKTKEETTKITEEKNNNLWYIIIAIILIITILYYITKKKK